MSSGTQAKALPNGVRRYLKNPWYISTSGVLKIFDNAEDEEPVTEEDVEAIMHYPSLVDGVEKPTVIFLCSGDKPVVVDWSRGNFFKIGALGKLSSYKSPHNLAQNLGKNLIFILIWIDFDVFVLPGKVHRDLQNLAGLITEACSLLFL